MTSLSSPSLLEKLVWVVLSLMIAFAIFRLAKVVHRKVQQPNANDASTGDRTPMPERDWNPYAPPVAKAVESHAEGQFTAVRVLAALIMTLAGAGFSGLAVGSLIFGIARGGATVEVAIASTFCLLVSVAAYVCFGFAFRVLARRKFSNGMYFQTWPLVFLGTSLLCAVIAIAISNSDTRTFSVAIAITGVFCVLGLIRLIRLRFA